VILTMMHTASPSVLALPPPIDHRSALLEHMWLYSQLMLQQPKSNSAFAAGNCNSQQHTKQRSSGPNCRAMAALLTPTAAPRRGTQL
jgi:hypothetical protein